ncbi:MAG: hypothetical protein KVP17_003608 [Porospora cf. gigantea B]|uniref:uncharacterized protein n=1 Tax=Porospora cf. gigantea B TaxID=2853592 RepID=UPI003571B286|nr:MAG: hypothetical protein KVP17_003608 [Porospora cf. gigantea B]
MSDSSSSNVGSMPDTWLTDNLWVADTWNETRHILANTISEIVSSFQASHDSMAPFEASTGFSFSPAGLLLPYHLGVACYLQEVGVLTDEVPIAGASAGALCTVLAGCGLELASVGMYAIYEVERNIEKLGAAGRLIDVLRNQFMDIIEDEHIAAYNDRPAPATVSYTSILPYPRGRFVSRFKNEEDLLDCLCASCNIPFYFASWPTVRCRGRAAVDGYFAVPRKYFGCPPTGAAKDIFVLPFPATRVKLKHAVGDAISPDLSKCDQSLTQQEVDDFRAYLSRKPCPTHEQLKELLQRPHHESAHCEDGDQFPGSSSRIMNYLAPLEHPLLTMTDEGADQQDRSELAHPDLPTMGLTISELLKCALDFAEDDTVQHLFDAIRVPKRTKL